jgi:hypothetical protein
MHLLPLFVFAFSSPISFDFSSRRRQAINKFEPASAELDLPLSPLYPRRAVPQIFPLFAANLRESCSVSV